MKIGSERRKEVLNALRKGAVPTTGLEALAVGLGRFETAIGEDLDHVAAGHGVFKAVRGEYGSGKTFFVRWLEERAKQAKFATAEVQISETETPLHHLEKVYRRAMERLSTRQQSGGALAQIVDEWLYQLEHDVTSEHPNLGGDELERAINRKMETRLAEITKRTPQYAAALRSYHDLLTRAELAKSQAMLAWLCAQPNISYSIKKLAGLKGDVDHTGALSFLQGLLVVLRDAGFSGLVLVLDEVETIQRVRSDWRARGLNVLRQLIDEVDGGRFPGLYLVITGTPAFFDQSQGVHRLPPLAQRLHTDFTANVEFDNPRAAQMRLLPFQEGSLVAVGIKVRDLYADGSPARDRILQHCDDAYIHELATKTAGKFGGKIGVVPRIFLKKLVADVLDRVEQFPNFDPRKDYALTLTASELTEEEKAVASVDDIPLSVH